MRNCFGVVVLVLGACGPRADLPESSGADSAMTMMPDSVLADSNRIIGHDSAFGPLFAVDSTGKLVDLPRKTP